jgi:hypothetical protein
VAWEQRLEILAYRGTRFWCLHGRVDGQMKVLKMNVSAKNANEREYGVSNALWLS